MLTAQIFGLGAKWCLVCLGLPTWTHGWGEIGEAAASIRSASRERPAAAGNRRSTARVTHPAERWPLGGRSCHVASSAAPASRRKPRRLLPARVGLERAAAAVGRRLGAPPAGRGPTAQVGA